MKIISLFDRSGVMVRPWFNAGHEVITVDIEEAKHQMPSIQSDIRDLNPQRLKADVIFGFPPCTHLARSGARWWKSKPPEALEEALELVNITKAICFAAKSAWMIENPVGRLNKHWRTPDWTFDPCEYAGFAPSQKEAEAQRYTKRTCIWSNFDQPLTRPLYPVLGNSPIMSLSPGPDRAYLRSITPSGFAQAVYLHLTSQPKQITFNFCNRSRVQ